MTKSYPSDKTIADLVLYHGNIKKAAKELNMVRSTVIRANRRYIEGKIKHYHPKKVIPPTTMRFIYREIHVHNMYISTVVSNLDLNMSYSTVMKRIHEENQCTYRKTLRKPNWKRSHLMNRISFANQHLNSANWHRWIFSDEKKFNYFGPDCSTKTWHVRNFPEKRQNWSQGGGKSVMVWLAMCSNHRPVYTIFRETLTSARYLLILQNHLLPLLNDLGNQQPEAEYIFQQDNAPAHMANTVKEYFRQNNINVVKWPSLSPDLNPIENLWSWISKKLYAHGKQYHNQDSLVDAIMRVIESIGVDFWNPYAASMNN